MQDWDINYHVKMRAKLNILVKKRQQTGCFTYRSCLLIEFRKKNIGPKMKEWVLESIVVNIRIFENEN